MMRGAIFIDFESHSCYYNLIKIFRIVYDRLASYLVIDKVDTLIQTKRFNDEVCVRGQWPIKLDIFSDFRCL